MPWTAQRLAALSDELDSDCVARGRALARRLLDDARQRRGDPGGREHCRRAVAGIQLHDTTLWRSEKQFLTTLHYDISSRLLGAGITCSKLDSMNQIQSMLSIGFAAPPGDCCEHLWPACLPPDRMALPQLGIGGTCDC